MVKRKEWVILAVLIAGVAALVTERLYQMTGHEARVDGDNETL